MKKNKQLIVIIVLLVVFFSIAQNEKKTSGETSSRAFDVVVYANLDTTISLSINPGTSTYYVVDEVVPSGWTVVSASNSGDYTTNPGHISWLVLSGAIPITYTYTANPANNLGMHNFTGTIGFENLPESTIGGDSLVEVVAGICTSGTILADCGADTDCLSWSCPSGSCVQTYIEGSCTPSGGGDGSCNAGVCNPIATTCYTCDDYGATHIDPTCSEGRGPLDDGWIEDNCGGFIHCGECGLDEYCDLDLQCQQSTIECTSNSQCNDNNLCTSDSCNTQTKKCVHTGRDGIACTTSGNPGTCNNFGQCVKDTEPKSPSCDFWEEKGDDGDCKLANWIIIVIVIFGALYALNIISK